MKSLSLFLLLIVSLWIIGCAPPTTKPANGKLRVTSTVGMIHDAVKNIGGEEVESVALMGPGIDPHLYRATAGDVKKLEGADIIFYGGLELEGRMNDVFVKMASKGTPTHAVSESVPEMDLREPPEFQGKFDPHIWFDLTLWKYAVEKVRDELIAVRPAHEKLFRANADKYLTELQDLHELIKMQVEEVPKDQRVLITAHDAFGYFGRQYGFEVIGIQGTSTASEAGAGSIRAIADKIAQRKIKAVFVESSVPKATVEALEKAVRARGWDVKIGGQLFSDAMGADGTPEGTYFGMVRHNVSTIVKALK